MFGYDVRVQETDARRPELGRTARVANIIAVLPGRRREAIGLSVALRLRARSPGRGGRRVRRGGVARGGARAGRAADRQWTTFVLVTDGEESGLMGAAALVDDRDVMIGAPRLHQCRSRRLRRTGDAVRRPGPGIRGSPSVGARARRTRAAASFGDGNLQAPPERHRLHRSWRGTGYPA